MLQYDDDPKVYIIIDARGCIYKLTTECILIEGPHI